MEIKLEECPEELQATVQKSINASQKYGDEERILSVDKRVSTPYNDKSQTVTNYEVISLSVNAFNVFIYQDESSGILNSYGVSHSIITAGTVSRMLEFAPDWIKDMIQDKMKKVEQPAQDPSSVKKVLYHPENEATSQSTDFSNRDGHIITVYQSPDRKHCSLRQIENNGEFNETGIPGRRYFLPDGFHVVYRYGHPSNILDAKGNDVYLINSAVTGRPQLCTADSKTGRIPPVGILLSPYSESPAELWDEYNTIFNAIDYNYSINHFGADHNSTLFKFAIIDCQKIIDNLSFVYDKDPHNENIRDELAAKHEQLKWLEKEAKCLNHSVQHEKLQDRINSVNHKNQKIQSPHTIVKQHEQQL